ncbi:MAG: hypothetical protein ABWX67_03135 [Allosphingosinicella sp.]
MNMKANQEKKLMPLGRATEQTKGFWGAFREEAGSVSRFGQIP